MAWHRDSYCGGQSVLGACFAAVSPAYQRTFFLRSFCPVRSPGEATSGNWVAVTPAAYASMTARRREVFRQRRNRRCSRRLFGAVEERPEPGMVPDSAPPPVHVPADAERVVRIRRHIGVEHRN